MYLHKTEGNAGLVDSRGALGVVDVLGEINAEQVGGCIDLDERRGGKDVQLPPGDASDQDVHLSDDM